MAAKTFTFDDIVRDAVKREIGKTGIGGESDFLKILGIKDLNDVTKFIQTLSNLSNTMQNRGGAGQPSRKIAPEPQKEASQATSTPAPERTLAINPEAVFNGLVSVMDGLTTVIGDVKLSEAKAFLIENKGQVLPIIDAQLKAIV